MKVDKTLIVNVASQAAGPALPAPSSVPASSRMTQRDNRNPSRDRLWLTLS